jgi:hypothetical protein
MTRAELTRRSDSPDRIATRAEWMRLTFGFVVVFALFQWSAVALGSDYGQKV